MTERGVVAKIKGNKATVRFDRRSACDKCHMCATTKDGMKVEVVVENTLGANVGDFVEVEMGEKYVLTAAAIVYVIPLVLIGAGIGIGTLINELAQALLALAGLVVGFVIAILLDRLVIRKKKGFTPTMKSICPESVEDYLKNNHQRDIVLRTVAEDFSLFGAFLYTVCACSKTDSEPQRQCK